MKHIAIVTSGGDAPGTNAAIRAAARFALRQGVEVSGVMRSFDGILKGEFLSLDRQRLLGIVRQGGTILKSSRTRLLTEEGDAAQLSQALSDRGIEGLLIIGGDGSHRAANALAETGFPTIAIPKTIDNDVSGTDYTIGFHTAVESATLAIDKLRTHTESNDRVMVVEVMGRHVGWIAAYAGIASGADLILIPERSWDLQGIAEHLRKRHTTDERDFSLIVVAEGASESQQDFRIEGKDRFDHLGRRFLGGIGEILAQEIEDQLGYECRCTTLGYLLRGGSPVASDRILATRLATHACNLLLEGTSACSVGIRNEELVQTLLSEVSGKTKSVRDEDYRLAEFFF